MKKLQKLTILMLALLFLVTSIYAEEGADNKPAIKLKGGLLYHSQMNMLGNGANNDSVNYLRGIINLSAVHKNFKAYFELWAQTVMDDPKISTGNSSLRLIHGTMQYTALPMFNIALGRHLLKVTDSWHYGQYIFGGGYIPHYPIHTMDGVMISSKKNSDLPIGIQLGLFYDVDYDRKIYFGRVTLPTLPLNTKIALNIASYDGANLSSIVNAPNATAPSKGTQINNVTVSHTAWSLNLSIAPIMGSKFSIYAEVGSPDDITPDNLFTTLGVNIPCPAKIFKVIKLEMELTKSPIAITTEPKYGVVLMVPVGGIQFWLNVNKYTSEESLGETHTYLRIIAPF